MVFPNYASIVYRLMFTTIIFTFFLDVDQKLSFCHLVLIVL